MKKPIKKNGKSRRVQQCFGVIKGELEDFIENKVEQGHTNGNVVNLKDLMG